MRFPGCQKATEWDGWRAEDRRLLVEPKLDGYRLSVIVTSDDVVSFHCAKAAPPDWAENLEHIAFALLDLEARDCMYDGELMARTWNETSSLVRRKRSLMDDAMKERCRTELHFHAFDFVPLTGFIEVPLPKKRKPVAAQCTPLFDRRALLIDALASSAKASPVLFRVPSLLVDSDEQLQVAYADFRQRGYEGAMVKDPNAPYFFDRIDSWRKIKPWKTIEVTVQAAVEGMGKHVGRLGALSCYSDDGVELSVGGGFSDELRQKYWTKWLFEPESLVGLRIEVTLQDSDVATARHTNFLRERPRDC